MKESIEDQPSPFRDAYLKECRELLSEFPDLSYLDRCPQWHAQFCPDCNLITPDSEYGEHQRSIKWTAGLCKCKPKNIKPIQLELW